MPLNVSVVDNANRADTLSDPSWPQDAFDNSDPIKIDSNQFAADFYCTGTYSPLTVNTDDGNLEVAYTVVAPPAATGLMIIGFVSGDTSESGYEAMWTVNTGVLAINRVDSTTRTELANVSGVSWSSGDLYIMRFLASGHLKVVQDRAGVETELLDTTDPLASYTGAFLGAMGAYDPAGDRIWRADNFAVGTYNADSITFTTRLSGGGSNSDPALSLGGTESSTEADGATLLSGEDNATRIAGRTRYRLVYHHNEDGTRTADVVAWLSASDIPAGVTVSLGPAAEGAGSTAAAIANETTAPSGVTFTAPTTVDAAVDLGSPGPDEATGLWVREVLTADTVDVETGGQAEPTATIKFRATPTS